MRRLRLDCFLVLPIVMALHDVAAAGIDETYNRPGPNIWSTDFYARMIGRNAFGKSVALVVGVGNYDRFPKLSAPASDAIRVRDFLRDEAGFDQIITLTDEKATYSRIAELMETVIPDAVGQNDRFLFYFSGHGVTRNLALTKRGYLVLKNSARGSWQGMIDMERMKQWTENVAQARHSLFLLDACFSGLAAFEVKAGDVREKTIARLMQPGHHIVTAGTEGEETFIHKQESLFTQAFLSAARGQGMTPQDGIVSLNEMMARVNRYLDAKQTEIGDKIRMTPRHYHSRITNNAGEFFFLPRTSASLTSPNIPPSASPEPTPKSGSEGTENKQESLISSRGAPKDEPGKFASRILGATDVVWKNIFEQEGKQHYRNPTIVLFTGSTRTETCGAIRSAIGPFYCPGDEKIYLDPLYLRHFNDCNITSSGCEFAQAYLIAREVGRHVQKQLGILPKVQQTQRGLSQTEADRLQVRVELQADCLAGVWANRAEQQWKLIEPGDIENGVKIIGSLDETTQTTQARGKSPRVPAQQREDWFRVGFKLGVFDGCNTFGAAQR